MKVLKYFLSAILIVATIWSCTDEDFGSLDFLSTATPPANVAALFNVTQDNTGTVTITPNSEGAVSYDIFYGDNTSSPGNVKQGESIVHVYNEGTYNVKVVAIGITGLTTEMTHSLVVSFKAPENLVVDIENDAAVSKKVNVTATADFAMLFEVYFGEAGHDEPVLANNGGTASYVYQQAGTYTIRVVSKSAAIQTTEYTQVFVVTAILQPTSKAPTPPARVSSDVVSIFSDAYGNIAISEWNPNWGQSTVLSSFVLDSDNILKYNFVNYTGIVTNYDSPTNLSAMEYVHFDYWTNDATQIAFKIVNTSKPNGSPLKESEVITPITEFGKWVSVDILLSRYTTDRSGITQLVLSSTGPAIFIDNIYFYKSPANCNAEVAENINPSAGNINWSFKTKDMAHTFEPFGNIASEIVDNPLVDALNGSCNVQSYVKTAGCETWSGVGKPLANAINLTASSDNVFKMKVFAKNHTTAVTLRLEFEPYPNVEPSAEIVKTMTKVGAWEELTFDFSAHAGKTFKSIIVYFDRNNPCDAATYYFDDIVQVSGGGTVGKTQIDLPVTFESATVDYTLTDFGGNASSVIADPTNASNMVAKVIKSNIAQTWAGTTIGTNAGFATNIPVTLTNSRISVRVWSPNAGTPIRLKIEDANAVTHTCETETNTTVAAGWETLIFDFKNQAPGTESLSVGLGNGWVYNKASIFFNFGTTGVIAGEKTYYFDDVVKITN